MTCPHKRFASGPGFDPECWRCVYEREHVRFKERFQSRFPNLLRDVKCGWSAPEGWNAPLERLCELLECIGGVECVQAKEKFGGLRFYLEDRPLRIDMMYPDGRVSFGVPPKTLADELVAACEAACWRICQDCGEPGKLRSERGWLSTRCDDCHEARWEARQYEE